MNQRSMLITIRKRTVFEWLTLWIVLLPLVLGVFVEALNLSGLIKYTADFAWVVLFVAMLLKKDKKVDKRTFFLGMLVLLFWLYTLFVYLFRFQSVYYYLWGLRNNFRFYIFFFAVITFLKKEDIASIFRLFNVAFWINIPVSFFQLFVFGYRGDYLGGIFGVQRGCNAYMIIFFIIVVGYSLLRCMRGKEKLHECFFKSFFALLISALAELKMFFVLFVLIFIAASFLTKFSWKKVLLLLFAATVFFFGTQLMTTFFEMEEGLSLSKIWELATQENYSDTETVNRLQAIPSLSNSILTEFNEQAFGLGLGNCDTAQFDFLNTPFYQKYSYLRYSWFSCSRLFVEVGYVGLTFFISFFVGCYFGIRKKINETDSPEVKQLGMLMAILCIILTFYNSGLHMEAGYMVYLVMALPFLKEGAALRSEASN